MATSNTKTNIADKINAKNDGVSVTPHDLHAHDIPLVVAPIANSSADINNNSTPLDLYRKTYSESIQDPNGFWSKEARKRLTWFHPFNKDSDAKCCSGSFEHGDVTWFAGGKLNVCYNAIDRHCGINTVDANSANTTNSTLKNKEENEKLAMIWEGDEPTDIRRISFPELRRKVSQIAHSLAHVGVGKGDVVTIYMPMSQYCDFLLLWLVLLLLNGNITSLSRLMCNTR